MMEIKIMTSGKAKKLSWEEISDILPGRTSMHDKLLINAIKKAPVAQSKMPVMLAWSTSTIALLDAK
jgi:hypothetical protein